jgi:hypothetical protein
MTTARLLTIEATRLHLAHAGNAQTRSFYCRDVRRMAQKAYYRLADEPSPVIEVACSKCEWKAGFNRAELVALYGEEYPLPDLLDHLAMPHKADFAQARGGPYHTLAHSGRRSAQRRVGRFIDGGAIYLQSGRNWIARRPQNRFCW